MDMTQCLIEVDSSVVVIEQGIMGCLERYDENNELIQASDVDNQHTLSLVEMLLKANSETANCEHEDMCVVQSLNHTRYCRLFVPKY